MSRPLTQRQREVLDFIVASVAEAGQFPTVRDIGAHIDVDPHTPSSDSRVETRSVQE